MADREDTTTKPLSVGLGTAAMRLEPGTAIGSYVVERELGSGGCAEVYAARHSLLKRRTAIKVLREEFASSYEMVQRFIREAQVVNVIRHPNVVDISEFGHLADGRPFFVMELLEGEDARAMLQRRGRLSAREVLTIVTPLTSALSAAHAAGVVHRDLKASNVFLVGNGPSLQVKLLDFGIAKLLHPEPGEVGLTTEYSRLGTAMAMAPEQILGQPVDARTDIYGLGVLLYVMLVGIYPFNGRDQLAVDTMHLHAAPPPLSSLAPVSVAVEHVVLRCLAKKQDDRFPSMEALHQAFRDAVESGEKRTSETLHQAIAISAECLAAENDEALWDVGPRVMEQLELGLTAAGFHMVLTTATSLLAVLRSSSSSEIAKATRQEAVALVRKLEAQAAAATAGTAVRTRLRAQLGEATETNGTLTGPLLDVRRWPLPAGDVIIDEALLRES